MIDWKQNEADGFRDAMAYAREKIPFVSVRLKYTIVDRGIATGSVWTAEVAQGAVKPGSPQYGKALKPNVGQALRSAVDAAIGKPEKTR